MKYSGPIKKKERDQVGRHASGGDNTELKSTLEDVQYH